MSNVTVIQTKSRLFFASDSAVSVCINGQHYRLHEQGQKLFPINNKKILFCSGRMDLVEDIVNEYCKSDLTIVSLKDIARKKYTNYIKNNDDQSFVLDILVGCFENNESVVYQISPYNDFHIVKRNVNNGDIGIWTGGIKTKESFNLTYKLISNGINLKNVFQQVFDSISDETIGGTLTVYSLDNNGLKLYYQSKIKEPKTIKYLSHELAVQNLIVGERIYGRIITGNLLTIGDEDGILEILGNKGVISDHNGNEIMWFGLLDPDNPRYGLEMNNGRHRVRVDDVHGFSIARWHNGEWEDLFFADTDGTLMSRRLRITNGEREALIDAEIGLIDFSKFHTIVGTLEADNISTDIFVANEGFINDLTVNRLKTIDSRRALQSEINYITVEDNIARWTTGRYVGDGQQARNSRGELLYWADMERKHVTTQVTPYPVYERIYDETDQLAIYFLEDHPDKIPMIEFSVGAPSSGNNKKSYIYKETDQFVIEFFNTFGYNRRIRMREEGIVLDNDQDGVVVINGGNFLITSRDLQEGWNENTVFETGGFFVPKDADGVYNRFTSVQGLNAARWKFDDANYILNNDESVTFYVGNTVGAGNAEARARIVRDSDSQWMFRMYGKVKADSLEIGTLSNIKIEQTSEGLRIGNNTAYILIKNNNDIVIRGNNIYLN